MSSLTRRDTTAILASLLIGGAVGASTAVAQISGVNRTRPQQRSLVFEHVTVLPMTENGAVVQDATVVIENERITSLANPGPRIGSHCLARDSWAAGLKSHCAEVGAGLGAHYRS